VIRVDTLEELLDTAQLLSMQPVPRGHRIAVLGNAGGPGILAADACAGAGLELVQRRDDRDELLPNPLDLGAAATPDAFAVAVEQALLDDHVDALLVVYAPPVVTDATSIAQAISAAASRAGTDKPLVACFLGNASAEEALRGIPTFAFPESAARALGRAARLGSWRARPPGSIPRFDDIDQAAARSVVTARLDSADGEAAWLDTTETAAVLEAYGIPVASARRADTGSEAVAAADELGFPVALKVGNPAIVHKTDMGGVELGLADGGAVAQAFDAMQARFGGDMRGAVVQRMVPPGFEVIVGITQDELFGPLLLFGAGGVAAELLADRVLRVLPFSTQDAHDTVRSLRTSPLLFGYRGSAPVDVDALEMLLQRVARLAEDVPEITEMDLNPVVVFEHGLAAVDCKIRCAVPVRQVPPDLRRMRD